MQQIHFTKIQLQIEQGSKDVKVAASKALNTVAFDALPKVVDRAKRDMAFKRDARRAMGMRVGTKARRSQREPKAQITTNRGWLAYHLDDGKRSPVKGWVIDGVGHVLVPVVPDAYTRRKTLKAAYKRRSYVLPSRRGGYLLMYRPKGWTQRRAIVIGVLKRDVHYREDTHPNSEIEKVFLAKAGRLFNYYLSQQK